MSRTTTTNVITNKTIHTGKGAVIMLIVSHDESTSQTVTLYDSLTASGSTLAVFKVAPESSPQQIIYPAPYFMRFNTGLTVEPGNCTVLITSAGN